MRLTAQQALGLAWLLDREGNDVFLQQRPNSPWLEVDFFTKGDSYTIWNTTGSVYKLLGTPGELQEVPDDPIFTPATYARHIANDRLLAMMERLTDERDRLREELGHAKTGP